MKNMLFCFVTFISLAAFANVETANVRVANGVVPNPVLAPLGQLVNVENGEVLYVVSLISVLAPDQLRKDCIYKINFTRSSKIRTQVQLVPPMDEVVCGQEVQTDK